jgi:hypothetical protein
MKHLYNFVLIALILVSLDCEENTQRVTDGGRIRDVGISDSIDISYVDSYDTSYDGLFDVTTDIVGEDEIDAPCDIISDTGIEDAVDSGYTDISADAGDVPELTYETIGFEDGELPRKGSFIFYNNWDNYGVKDTIEMISPDGSYKGIRMYAKRVWSFGIGLNGSTIAFSTNDPYQQERYGLNIYDAIQNTWLLKNGELPVQISFGPVNDECHNFLSDNKTLLMCRRANFRPDPQYMAISDPYRILVYDLIEAKEEYLTPLDSRYNDYAADVRYDGIILFNRNTISARTIDIMTLNRATGDIGLLLKDANTPVFSRDGKKVLFRKKGSNKLFMADADSLDNPVVLVDGVNQSISEYAFSPDGEEIAYTIEDRASNCSDLMVVKKDGTESRKILDCSDEKKFITVIKWVDVE